MNKDRKRAERLLRDIDQNGARFLEFGEEAMKLADQCILFVLALELVHTALPDDAVATCKVGAIRDALRI